MDNKQPKKLKLEIKKESLRPLDTKELDLLDSVVGGTGGGGGGGSNCTRTTIIER